MDDTGNVFNNDIGIPPALSGQGEPTSTENVNPTPTATPAPEGQTGDGQQPSTNPAQNPAPDKTWADEFKSPEEMYAALQNAKKAYSNLQPAYTKVTQELSNIRKNVRTVDNQTVTEPTQPTVTPTPTPTPTPTQQTYNQQVNPMQLIIDKVKEIVNPIQEQQQEITMQATVQRVMQEHSDFLELAPKISELFKDNPELWNLKNPIESAYKLVKADNISTAVGTAIQDVRAQAYADKDIKVLTGSERTPTATPTVEKTPEEQVRESILGAMKGRGSVFG